MVFQKSKRSKRKAYFISANPLKKRKIDVNLSPGMKGFICTCNGNMKGCIREALNILDDYDSKINLKNSQDEDEDKDSEDVDDIEKSLQNEISSVKNLQRNFKPVDTGANNCLFISSQVNNVLEIADAVMKDVEETKVAKSRYLIRLVPIEITCKAYNDDIKKAADSIFDAHFKGEPTSYCIHINKRSNNNLLRKEVTDDLARLVRDRNINHVVDLKNPAKTVIVEIIRNVCCLSVVNNFFRLRKYNLLELANSKNTQELQKNEESLNSSSGSDKISESKIQPEDSSNAHKDNKPVSDKISESKNQPEDSSNAHKNIKPSEPDVNKNQTNVMGTASITQTDINTEAVSDISEPQINVEV